MVPFCQNSHESDDYESISTADALFLVAGDPTSDEEPMRKGSCFQVVISCEHLLSINDVAAMASWLRIPFHPISFPKEQHHHSLFRLERYDPIRS